MIHDNNNIGTSGFYWFIGVVEDRQDPLKLGRVRVRCYFIHTANKALLPTADLPWATVATPVTEGSASVPMLAEGTTVHGFFIDGEEMQSPLITHVLPGVFVKQGTYQQGFNDPREQVTTAYPGYAIPNANGITEPAVRYTLPSNTPTTATYNRGVMGYANEVKKTQQRKSIQTTQGVQFDEVNDPFAAKYPYNHAHESESGHVIELDDTPGAERVQVFHRAGSFIEIHPDGKTVVKSIGDSETITIKNRKSYVEGAEYGAVEKGKYLRTGATFDIEVTSDDYNLEVLNGNIRLQASKDLNLIAGGDINITAGGSIIANGTTIELN